MARTPLNTPDPARSKRHARFDGQVPQEHTGAPNPDSPPRDWSHMGRRVLAEAWRRTTDDLATRPLAGAGPAVPAPHTPEDPQA